MNWTVSQGSQAEESWVGGTDCRHFNSFTMPAFTVNMLAVWILWGRPRWNKRDCLCLELCVCQKPCWDAGLLAKEHFSAPTVAQRRDPLVVETWNLVPHTKVAALILASQNQRGVAVNVARLDSSNSRVDIRSDGLVLFKPLPKSLEAKPEVGPAVTRSLHK